MEGRPSAAVLKRKAKKQKRKTAKKKERTAEVPSPVIPDKGKGNQKSLNYYNYMMQQLIVGKEKRSENDIPEEVDAIFEDGETDSRLRAAELFRWLIFPVDPEVFFEEYWEKKPLIIQRNKQTDGEGKDYYKVSQNLSPSQLIFHHQSGLVRYKGS